MPLFQQPFMSGGFPSMNRVVATEFDSMYESFNPLTTVNKQHFVEWFSGSGVTSGDDITPDSIWTFDDVAGVNTGEMFDGVDEGYRITTDTNTNDRGSITFYDGTNNHRQYEPTGYEVIGVMKREDHIDAITISGLCETSDYATGTAHSVECEMREVLNNFVAIASSNGSITRTASDIALDGNWVGYKLTGSSTNNKLTVNGVLKVTKTTNRPTNKCHPIFEVQTGSARASYGAIRYMECYNT